ncbi:NUDIX domain-containing protein [Flavobacterium ginsenosidimutans]|uniref:NUDIX domain-containing protein n=1 Tax=Flavobacterium ginsenosidimutans TaxID=687844 RepID=UPI000DADC6B5|nr:NUDIX domain-containing protein [Flavobacterium ginsenosidimutans]KAF2327929.1 NUDIX domain-containing protein [Flavobacterium ginsenosidimutans]
MKPLYSFNVRAYAICENDNKILALYEYHKDKIYCKFPGGGVEFGEGILDCLHREFQEELNAKIKIVDHLYTQEHFVESIIDDGRQILLVYYIVKISNLEEMAISTPDIQRFEWIDVNENPFVLPIDKIALAKYRERFNILKQ